MNDLLSSPIKRAATVTISIGILLCMLQLLQLQDPKFTGVYSRLIEGAVLIGAGIAMIALPRFARKIFTLLTWVVTIYIAVIMTAVMKVVSGPFFVLGALFNPARTFTFALQSAAIIGVLIYFHRTRVRLGQSPKNSKKRARSKKASTKTKLITAGIGLCFIVLAGAAIIPFITGTAGDSSYGKRDTIAADLEKKYLEKFTVFDFKTEKQWHSSFQSEEILKAKAHPVKNPEITFDVSGCIERCETYERKGGTFDDRDSYIYESWAYERKPVVEQKLKEVFGAVPAYEIEVTTGFRENQFPDGPPPALESVKATEGVRLHFSVATFLDGVFTEENLPLAQTRTQTLTEFVKSFEIAIQLGAMF